MRYDDGARERADYYQGQERVGERWFFASGELEHEAAFRNGVRYGWQYRWDAPGVLLAATFYADGLEHGTAAQWGSDGRLLGIYALEQGTGWDLWWQEWNGGKVELTEAIFLRAGQPHGFEWAFYGERRLSSERHWQAGVWHGIARDWNGRGQLGRTYPRYRVNGRRVSKAKYLRASAADPTLPPCRAQDDAPNRIFPAGVEAHLPAASAHESV